MSSADKSRWERRYAEGSYASRTYASPFLSEWLPAVGPVEPGDRALDLGCGTGRNALHVAEAGYRVDAVDISATALSLAADAARSRGLEVNWIQADLDVQPLEPAAYSFITVVRYMNRLMVPRVRDALRHGGWLLFEHHYRSDEDVDGPRGAEFRLQPQELLHAFHGLHVVHYQESVVTDPDLARMALARLVARRP
jgi:SAM-dependent methyltransferase